MKTRQISAWLLAGMVMSTVFTSCKKEEDNTISLPPIGGYNSSNDIAATNLVAHWTFDGTNNEDISKTAPSTAQGASFTTGKKGQALNLANGFLAYPEIASLSKAAFPNYSVAAWVNVKNNGDHPTMFFTLTRPGNPWDGNINLLAETGAYKSTVDTLKAKIYMKYSDAGNEIAKDNINSPEKGGDQALKASGQWVHLVGVYDGATIRLYGNGKRISNPDYETWAKGNITFFTPAKVVIGGFGTNAPGGTPDTWQQPMNGQLDEIRLYNKALPEGDISALYNLELAGR